MKENRMGRQELKENLGLETSKNRSIVLEGLHIQVLLSFRFDVLSWWIAANRRSNLCFTTHEKKTNSCAVQFFKISFQNKKFGLFYRSFALTFTFLRKNKIINSQLINYTFQNFEILSNMRN